jgi:hypothetical protein
MKRARKSNTEKEEVERSNSKTMEGEKVGKQSY